MDVCRKCLPETFRESPFGIQAEYVLLRRINHTSTVVLTHSPTYTCTGELAMEKDIGRKRFVRILNTTLSGAMFHGGWVPPLSLN